MWGSWWAAVVHESQKPAPPLRLWLGSSRGAMIEQFVNFVIRPPRAEYNPDQYLWEPEFTLAGRKYKRIDLEATFQ